MDQPSASSQAQMTCPKCAGAMRAYERNGITIDQCSECRGIFLDRGELERLVEAEDAHYQSAQAPAAGGPPAPPGYDPAGYPPPGYDPRYASGGKHGGGHGYSDPRYGYPKKRRGGLLGELLDF